MKATVIKIIGIEGLLLILFGFLAYLFAPAARFISIFFIASGAICIAIYVGFGWSLLRSDITSRSAKYGANAATYTLIVLAIVVLLNVFAARHPKQWDATSAKVNTLAEQSIQILSGLEEDVKVLHFSKILEAAGAEQLLDKYAYTSDRFTFEIIDPDQNPQIVDKYKITQYGQSVILAGENEYLFDGMAEQDVTSAIIQVTKSDKRTLYFVEGHGEPDINDQGERGYKVIADALANESIEAVSLLLASQKEIPSDASAVVIAGGGKPLLENEIRLITDYVQSGGSLLLLSDPMTTSGLEPMLADLGVQLEDTVIVDQRLQLFAGPKLGLDPIVESYGPHAITEGFAERTVFNMARSISSQDVTAPGVVITDLARTGETSWAERDLKKLITESQVEMEEEQDTAGPLTIAVAIEKEIISEAVVEGDDPKANEQQPRTAKIVVVGDSDFAGNKFSNYLFNADFFMNIASWLVGEQSHIAIRPRSYAPSAIQLTSEERAVVFYLSIFIIPQLMMMIGIAVILRRKQQ